ncbi:MAG: sugar transferase [Croceibacterium sp.]
MHRLKLDLDELPGETETVPLRRPFASAPASPAELGLIVVPSEVAAGPADGDGGGDAREPVSKRLLDLVISLALLILLAPVMLVIAAAIMLSDLGAPVFIHRRLGQGGRTFPCLKFRTMCLNADRRLEELLITSPDLRAQWQRDHKLDNDPRVTRLGRLLRITSLDELPQLFNVLVGHMSMVGPRPIVVAELHNYGRYAAHYFSVKPGLSGIWQVSGRSDTTYRRRVAADVLYVRSRSLLLDLRIMACTIPAVLTGKGSC